MKPTPSLAMPFLAVALAACHGTSPPTYEPDDGVVGIDTGGSDAGDATFADLPPVGWVSFGLTNDPIDGGAISAASAAFGGNAAVTCGFTDLGACQLATCPSLDADPYTLTPVVTNATSAGDITLTATGAQLVLDPSTGYPYEASGDRWTAGQTVTVTAVGATVPGFSTSVTFPSQLSLQSPSVSNGIVTLPLASGFDVVWTPVPGQVWVTLRHDEAGRSGNADTRYVLRCRYDATSGRGTVPPAALTHFSVSLGDLSDLFHAFPVATSTLDAGAVPVTVSAYQRGVTALIRFD